MTMRLARDYGFDTSSLSKLRKLSGPISQMLMGFMNKLFRTITDMSYFTDATKAMVFDHRVKSITMKELGKGYNTLELSADGQWYLAPVG